MFPSGLQILLFNEYQQLIEFNVHIPWKLQIRTFLYKWYTSCEAKGQIVGNFVCYIFCPSKDLRFIYGSVL